MNPAEAVALLEEALFLCMNGERPPGAPADPLKETWGDWAARCETFLRSVQLTRCACGHLELSHDLNAKGVRTACFHIDGPRGVHCGCTHFNDSKPWEITPPTTGTSGPGRAAPAQPAT